jgi:uncharacterized membrane protein
LFLAAFLGALVFTGLVAALHLGEDVRSVRLWSAAAFVLYLASLVVTARVNVPLNDGIKVAGAPDRIADVTSVREQFNEPTWVRWNLVRALLTVAALGWLAWSLLLLVAPRRPVGRNASATNLADHAGVAPTPTVAVPPRLA